jgi:hypothetical protein
VTDAADVLDALDRPIDEEFRSTSWSLSDSELLSGQLQARGWVTVTSRDAAGDMAVREESGEYVRDHRDAPWKTTGEVAYREARYVDGDLFQRGPDVGDTGSTWSAGHWVPVEAVTTHARFQPWTALGHEYLDASPGLVADPRAARTPLLYLRSEVVPGPVLSWCTKSATGTPPTVTKARGSGNWRIECGDDLGMYTYHVHFDEQGRVVSLLWEKYVDAPIRSVDSVFPIGMGVVFEYRTQQDVQRPDTVWFETAGLRELDRVLLAACNTAGPETCVDADLTGLTADELAAKFAEELSENRQAEYPSAFANVHTYGRFRLAGLDIDVPQWRFTAGGTVASYTYDEYAVVLTGGSYCIRYSATRFELAAGAC